MRVMLALIFSLTICHQVIASQQGNGMVAADEEDALFKPVDGMYAGLDEATLTELAKKKSAEINTYEELIGKARDDQLRDMLAQSKVERKAGCILMWSSKGLAAASGAATALNAALGGPSWVSYITGALTIVTPIITHIAQSLSEDGSDTEKKVIKRKADSLKELHQINEALRALKDLNTAQEANKQLAKQVDRIQKHLLLPPSGDVVLNMGDDAEGDDSKGKEDDVKPASPAPLKSGKMVKRKKGSKGHLVPPKVVPKQTDPQGVTQPLVSGQTVDPKLEEVLK